MFSSQDTTNAVFENLKTFWTTQLQEATDVPLQALGDSNWQMPAWMNGSFYTSGPSQFEMGEVKLGMALDGFGRFNKFEFKDGEVLLTSKMLDSKWHKLCQEKNDIEPQTLFAETIPPRKRSRIPGMNMYYASKFGDNIFVQVNEMPDKTMVVTTDLAVPLIIDKDTLKQQGYYHWDDKIACVIGITHFGTLKDGTQVSYCSNEGASGSEVHVYKVHPSKPKTRVLIGSIKTKNLAYGHSIGVTEDYAIILEQPIKFSMISMFEGKPMVDDMVLEKESTTKIHVMKLSDGTTQTFETGWLIALHHGNSYLEDENTLVMELQTYNNKDSNPFSIVFFDKLFDVNKMTDQAYDSKFQKFTLNLKDGTFKVEDYVEAKNGTIDMPMWNPKYDGVKNCFTYLSHQFGAAQIDENYSFPIHKYDSC